MYVAELVGEKDKNRIHSFMIPADNYQEALDQFKERLREAFPKRFLKRGSLENELKRNWKITNLNDWIE